MSGLFLQTGYEDRYQRKYPQPCQIFLHNSVIVLRSPATERRFKLGRLLATRLFDPYRMNA
jgi:hypothetical protein